MSSSGSSRGSSAASGGGAGLVPENRRHFAPAAGRGFGPGVDPGESSRARPSAPRASALRRLAALFELTKPRITGLVTCTTAVGFHLAAPMAAQGALLWHTLLGTALTAGGTNALNQFVERGPDARMRRTRERPLPSGRVGERAALSFGLTISAVGILHLLLFVNALTAGLAAGTLVSYVALYTPLKRRTWLATVVGAVPGALPVLGGWAAAAGRLEGGAWILFAILFLWQLPHFLGLGWLYRHDYRRGGFPVLGVVDRSGRWSAALSLGSLCLLSVVGLLPGSVGLTDPSYTPWALLAGLGFLAAGLPFAARVSGRHARLLFVASVVYLPALLLLLAFHAA